MRVLIPLIKDSLKATSQGWFDASFQKFADENGTVLLRIGNVNKRSGVVGVFNCQDAGWYETEKKTHVHDVNPASSLVLS